MLVSTQSSAKWKKLFLKKFLNFSRKSPILMSVILTIQEGFEGAQVTHTNSDTIYFFPFDYNIEVKDFISDIKKLLVAKHYPRVVDEIFEKHELSTDELAKSLENGKSIEDLQKFELRKVGERQYRIDKLLVWRNTFILVLERSSYEEDLPLVGTSYIYRMNMSSVIFLKKYRQNGFGGLREASRFFFDNTVLVRSLEDDTEVEKEDCVVSEEVLEEK